MFEELHESSGGVQLRSITARDTIYSSLIDDSAGNKRTANIGQILTSKTWLYYPMVLGVAIGVLVLLGIAFVPVHNQPNSLEGNFNESDEVYSSSPTPIAKDSFAEQSSTVQHQLMTIASDIHKGALASPNSTSQTVPTAQPDAPAAIYLSKSAAHVPARKTSLPTRFDGPNSRNMNFPTVYHPEEEVLVTKPVFEDTFNISNYGTYKLTIYSEDGQHVIAETLLDVIPQIEICVPKQFIIHDSVNNPVTNGTVTLKRVGEDAVAFTGITDKLGIVNVTSELDDGSYEVDIFAANSSRLAQSHLLMLVFRNRRQEAVHSFLARNDLKPNEVEIVLQWAAEPGDLDSHLYTSDGGHIYFSKKTGINMSLDCDVVTGHGPETVRFTIQSTLAYIYAVYRYSNETLLTHSKAEVMFSLDARTTQITYFGTQNKLTRGEKLSIPQITRPEATLWVVFMIDGATKQIRLFDKAFENIHYTNKKTIGRYFTT